MVSLVPGLVHSREHRVQLAVGNTSLSNEEENLPHQSPHRDPGDLHCAKVGVGVQPCDGEVDSAKGHPPVAGPPLHHLEEGAGVGTAIIGELLNRRVVLRVQPLDSRLLQDLDRLLQELAHLVRLGGAHLLVQGSEAAQSGFHGCKQRGHP